MIKRFIPLASDLMQPFLQQKIIDIYLPIFKEYGLVQSSQPMQDGENYFLILSGGTENKFLEILKEMEVPDTIKLIAIGMNNSFPAALEILAYVYQNGLKGTIYYLQNERDFDALKD